MANEKLSEIVSDLGDITLDQITETGEALPVISFISKSIKAYNTVRDHFFMEKVIKYLTEIANVPPGVRAKTIQRIAADEKYGVKFGKKVLNIIDRFDDEIKAHYLAKAYKYLAEEQITLEFYLRFCTLLDSMLLANIETLQTDWILLDGHPTNKNLERLGLVNARVSIFDVKNPGQVINAEKYKVVFQPGYYFTGTGRVINNMFIDKPVYYKSKYKNAQDFNKHVQY